MHKIISTISPSIEDSGVFYKIFVTSLIIAPFQNFQNSLATWTTGLFPKMFKRTKKAFSAPASRIPNSRNADTQRRSFPPPPPEHSRHPSGTQTSPYICKSASVRWYRRDISGYYTGEEGGRWFYRTLVSSRGRHRNPCEGRKDKRRASVAGSSG